MYYLTSEIGTTSLQGTKSFSIYSVPHLEVPLYTYTPELCNDKWKVGVHEGFSENEFSEDVFVHQLNSDSQTLYILTLLLWRDGERERSEGWEIFV